MAYLGNTLQVAYPSYRVIDDISSQFNGVLKTFALKIGGIAPVPFPINPQQCLISVNGVIQKPDSTGASGFTLTGTNIVFASAPSTGWAFFGTVLAGADYVNVGANFPSGTAAVPSVTFDQSTGTGLYLASSNVLGIATSGVQQLTVDSSGNVSVTGVISSAAGSATNPGIQVGTGTTYKPGIYSPGTDQLAITAGGSGRLFVTSTGLVGIGTSSPNSSYKLDVAGAILSSSSSSEIAIVNRATNAAAWAFYSQNGEFNIYQWSAATNRLVIDTSGRVGIGTTGPTQLLSLASASGNSYIEVAGVGYTLGTNSVYYGQDSSGNGVMWNRGNNYLLFGTYNTERVRIDNSGRLLVGTSTSPSVGSWSQYSRLVAKGNTTGNAGAGVLNLGTAVAATSMGTNDSVGVIAFSDLSGNEFATIGAFTDGTISSTSDLPGKLVFSTTADGASSPTERMRIDNTGTATLTVGATNASNITAVATSTSYTSSQIAINNYTVAGTGFYFLQCWSGNFGSSRIRILGNGDIQNVNNAYGAISDFKLKENIVDANSQWDDLKALRVRKYNFKEGQTHTQIGLVAQEVELVSPGLVSESPDRDAEGNDLGTVTKSVNYSVLYMKAVKALQEAMERIEQLETSNADLLARVTVLEAA